jgi:lipoprotein-anchoring transpeptidase ErfK/SrfK
MRPSGGEYSIHGTNDPNSIGRFVPYGCIRMFNEDSFIGASAIGTQVVVE